MNIPKKARVLAAFFIAVMALVIPAVAHHSFTAEYDTSRPVPFTGTGTTVKWANPHAWIYVDVVDPKGKVVNWALETGAANGLIRRGWRKEDLPAGTVVIVEGWQARNGSPTANVSSITFSDGRRLFAGSSNPAAPQQ